MKYNKHYGVQNMAEFIEAVNSFAGTDMVWFRGHEDVNYNLLPTLYRNKVVDFYENNNFNSIHYAENVRMQQYYARNYQFIKDDGRNKTEWLGMAQHFGINTRFFDWSTSAIHSAIFALEQYFDDKCQRNTAIPCIWVLKPQKLNKIIVDEIVNNADKIQDPLTRNFASSREEIVQIIDMIKSFKHNYSDCKNVYFESNSLNNWGHLDYMYNLAYFDRLLEISKTNPKLAFSGHVLNPLYFLLSNAYIEGDAMDLDIIKTTPLAIIHPINNNRIMSQHGVFTLFPFPDKEKYDKCQQSLDYLKMEDNPAIKGTLCRIDLLSPKKISDELKLLGAHKSWLFHEQDRISKEIESGL